MSDSAATGHKAAGRPALVWAMFAVLTLLWAGAYALTRVAVGKDTAEGLPVAWVLPGRLMIGALVLWAVLIVMRGRMPPLRDRARWGAILGMGIAGSLLPFFLITTAQQTVNSSLAALYTAAAPVFVVIGANMLFAEERMTRASEAGIALGFIGVAVLFGPDALADFGSASVTAQILLILATLAYAISTLIVRGAPMMSAIAFAAGYASVSALLALPLAFTVDPQTVTAGWQNWAAVIALGLGPSGLAQLLYVMLVARAGATFLSLTGYAIPIVSAVLGWIFFRETQDWNALAAFALILGGVWIARSSGRGRQPG